MPVHQAILHPNPESEQVQPLRKEPKKENALPALLPPDRVTVRKETGALPTIRQATAAGQPVTANHL